MDENFKVRENRARRAAARQGLQLVKSRRRDPRAYDYGGYMLADADTTVIIFGGENGVAYSASLDDVEEWLQGEKAAG